MSFNMIVAVSIGGSLGAVGRLLIHNFIGQMFGQGFPFGTIFVNILGSFCLGVLIEGFSNIYAVTPEIRAFFVIGVLGSFTTFSTFSFDFVALWIRDEFLLACVYMLGSVLLGIIGSLSGTLITRAITQ